MEAAQFTKFSSIGVADAETVTQKRAAIISEREMTQTDNIFELTDTVIGDRWELIGVVVESETPFESPEDAVWSRGLTIAWVGGITEFARLDVQLLSLNQLVVESPTRIRIPIDFAKLNLPPISGYQVATEHKFQLSGHGLSTATLLFRVEILDTKIRPQLLTPLETQIVHWAPMITTPVGSGVPLKIDMNGATTGFLFTHSTAATISGFRMRLNGMLVADQSRSGFEMTVERLTDRVGFYHFFPGNRFASQPLDTAINLGGFESVVLEFDFADGGTHPMLFTFGGLNRLRRTLMFTEGVLKPFHYGLLYPGTTVSLETEATLAPESPTDEWTPQPVEQIDL